MRGHLTSPPVHLPIRDENLLSDLNPLRGLQEDPCARHVLVEVPEILRVHPRGRLAVLGDGAVVREMRAPQPGHNVLQAHQVAVVLDECHDVGVRALLLLPHRRLAVKQVTDKLSHYVPFLKCLCSKEATARNAAEHRRVDSHSVSNDSHRLAGQNYRGAPPRLKVSSRLCSHGGELTRGPRASESVCPVVPRGLLVRVRPWKPVGIQKGHQRLPVLLRVSDQGLLRLRISSLLHSLPVRSPSLCLLTSSLNPHLLEARFSCPCSSLKQGA
mmetsp:Transcript_38220/g.75087  ORF Transcript_38220/g.75087 Transcript_38220/m.75087 type:complete len:271 (-) Transcript_38220:566-1378(-)